jgi:hypothetical protein
VNLTICLITKGRYQFLNDALKSYEPFLNSGFVNVVLIDNNSADKSRELLLSWKHKHVDLVEYVRLNDGGTPKARSIWENLKGFNPDWIVFPGDDDIIEFSILDKLKEAVSSQPNILGYSTSAEIIDISGTPTGLIRKPAIHGLTTKIEQLSKSFHEPPFLWPGLFFKFNSIPPHVPQSRFVFDWWVGIQLILNGEVKTTNSIGIKYRIHDGQESNQSPSRRKYFEGFQMLSETIESRVFNEVVDLMSANEITSFMNLVSKEKPLYSQPEYSIALLKGFFSKFIYSSKMLTIRHELIENYLSTAGVLTKKNDLSDMFINSSMIINNSPGNVAINFDVNACDRIVQSKECFNANSAWRFTVSCEHSVVSGKNIKINCSQLSDSTKSEVADKILHAVNTFLEKNDYLFFNTTPLEKSIISFIRKNKVKLPKLVLKKTHILKSALGKKNEI